MSNPGFNIKVREVENGCTIHLTAIDAQGVERHKDYIASTQEDVQKALQEITLLYFTKELKFNG